MYIKIIIKYLLIACVCFFSKSVLAEGITLTMDFDKEEYKKGEVVNIDLKSTEVDDISINSLGIKIKYNSSILELAGNDPKQDINDGYIPFTTKANIQSNNEEACIDLMYISMFEEVRLKDGEVIASITLKVKDNAHTGVSVISIEQVNMLNDLTMFSVNAGNKREFSISITDESLDEEQKDTRYNDLSPKTNRVVKKDKIVEDTVQVGIIDEGDPEEKEKSNEAQPEDMGNINHTFVDIEGHWAKDSILYLTSQGIKKGFDDNIFAPDLFIKRAEFAAFIIRAFSK